MSTAPVATAPHVNEFENILNHIASGIRKFNNSVINLANEEEPVIAPLLPPNVAAVLGEFLASATTQLAATDAKYAAIGQSSAPWAVKAAEAAAVGGIGLLAILAKAGITVTTGQLPVILAAIPSVAANLNLTGITLAPVVPIVPVAPVVPTTPAA